MTQVRSQPTIKLGLMGFGQIGRMIYQLAQHQPDIEITDCGHRRTSIVLPPSSGIE